MDREKVVKDNAIFDLQSAIEIGGALVHLRKEHAKAILAMLKEQEAASPNNIKKSASYIYNNLLVGYCPKCGSMLTSSDNSVACGRCGQAVKWE